MLEGMTGRCELWRDGSLIGVTRYDPDMGFGQVPPTLQPMLVVMRSVLLPFDEKIRFVQRAGHSPSLPIDDGRVILRCRRVRPVVTPER